MNFREKLIQNFVGSYTKLEFTSPNVFYKTIQGVPPKLNCISTHIKLGIHLSTNEAAPYYIAPMQHSVMQRDFHSTLTTNVCA